MKPKKSRFCVFLFSLYRSKKLLVVTLSPIIMVQWTISPNERKLILEIHPFSTPMIMGGRVNHLGSQKLYKEIVSLDLLKFPKKSPT